jgi:predicted aminopeptidase
MATRARLAKLYAQPSSTQMRREKQHAFDDLRQQYSELKASWGGFAGYDDWFSHDLNNAKLNTVANYYDYVPGFQQLLESNGGDLGKFYIAAERLSKEPLDKRHQKLRNVTK